jgi:hypothetical protein
MLKKTITYDNFDGETVTDDFYFSLTEAEFVELEFSGTGNSYFKHMQNALNNKNMAGIYAGMKTLILASYGERGQDGKFRKSEDIRNAFQTTEAYSKFLFEMASDENAAAAFLQGIVPKSMADKTSIEEVIAQSKEEVLNLPTEIPPPPTETPKGSMTREDLLAAMRAKNAQ